MSHLDKEPRTPPQFWFALLAFLALVVSIFALSCPGLDAAEPEPRVYTSLLAWKLFVVDHDGTAYRRGGNLFGGRAIAGMDLKGGLHVGLRGDASALSDFELENPSSWRSLEGYGALSRPFALGPITAGPAVMAGALVPVSTEASWSSRPTYGGGLRLGRGRSWAYILAGTNGAADERTPGLSPIRMLAAAQIEFGRIALVGDVVSGPGGFARAGVGYRLPIPWGAKP